MKAVFKHDFGKGGFPDKYFVTEGANKLTQFTARRDGVFVNIQGKGGWIDVVRWRDRHAADSAMKAAEKSEICASAFSMLDPKFEEMNHITVAHRFNK